MKIVGVLESAVRICLDEPRVNTFESLWRWPIDANIRGIAVELATVRLDQNSGEFLTFGYRLREGDFSISDCFTRFQIESIRWLTDDHVSGRIP